MRIILTANHVPFARGGGEYHIRNLYQALQQAGHQVELLRFPFLFQPESQIERLMEYCEHFPLHRPEGHEVDQVISLQFPAYGVDHPNHRVWIMHQHRAVYELYDEPNASPELKGLRDKVSDYDRRVLARARLRFANSRRVAERLQHYNGLEATPLYHPPPHAEQFQSGESQGYIYAPGRLETLKRQALLIEAMRFERSGIPLLISGEGGQREMLEGLIERHNLRDRVRLLGRVDRATHLTLYKHAAAVWFGPLDEDYGYVTLEAMLAARPVITCSDSGGPLEFVEDGRNGLVTQPELESIAEAISTIGDHPAQAREMGEQGREDLEQRKIHWSSVVERLTAGDSATS